MRAAGVRPDDAVLLVGHSQGALDAVRIAQHGGQRVAGVVTLGGPTGQLVLPADVPVLAVEHEEDPVPALGGAVAGGAAGLTRVVIRRRLYDHATPPPATGVPSHALETYAETLHLADRAPEPRLTVFRRRIAPFLAGTGSVALYRAERTAPATPSRDRRAAGARAR
jgi:pimeloyl-ACP methyl ester carboxylesterase